MKGNMSLLQAKQLVWDEMIASMKINLKYRTLMDEQKIMIKDYDFFILAAKQDGEKNSQISKKFIQFVNERPLSELRPIGVVDGVSAIMELSKVFQKEEAKVKAKECLKMVHKYVNAFHAKFDARVKEGLPCCSNLVGILTPWTQYKQMLVEAKINADSSNEKMTTLKEKTMVNYLIMEFQLFKLIETLFHPRLDYIVVTNLKITYQ